jgi:hypothetical protein
MSETNDDMSCRAMDKTSRRPTHIALTFGVLEFLGYGFWCIAGLGIYGSPLAGMSLDELDTAWQFLLLGPFSFLPAAS